MIKPVTFQGISNFKANLYALEVKSRFIDQANANGYYKNYGSELAAVVIGETIQVGTGAFVVQGRMSEITIAEIVTKYETNIRFVCSLSSVYWPIARNFIIFEYPNQKSKTPAVLFTNVLFNFDTIKIEK